MIADDPRTAMARGVSTVVDAPVARITLQAAEMLAEWLAEQAAAMSQADERKPGFIDLADRLRRR